MDLIANLNSNISSVTGITSLVRLWHANPILAILLVISLGLTPLWLIRLQPKTATNIGKFGGGLALSFLKIIIVFGIFFACANIGLRVVFNMIFGGIFPMLGSALARIANQFMPSLMSLAVIISLGWYIVKNVGSLLSGAERIVAGTMSAWRSSDGAGFNGVKWPYVIAGNLLVAMVVCHPALNTATYFVPALVSGVLGVFALILALRAPILPRI